MMRTFVALNLDAAARTRLHASLEPLRGRPLPVRWLDEHALHLTLKFLGDTEGAAVAALGDALRDTARRHAPLTLELTGFGAFPSLRRASVLWVGVAPSEPLLALQAEVELALARLGWGREQKPFRPHITVGRVRSGARPPDVERAAAGYDYHDSVHVATIDLMRSHLGPAGARYEAVLREPLRGGEDALADEADGVFDTGDRGDVL
jgi:RNA 2',3'-cyclic 3'-phosphodiesterase